jgi:protein TonB
LSFVIEPTGRITNIKVLKDVGGGATNEAIRLLKLTKWRAGKKDGISVRVSKEFEVNFNLSNDAGMDYVPSSY